MSHATLPGSRGIAAGVGPVDMPALIDGKQALVETFRAEKYVDIAESYGWQVRRGDARFDGTPDAPVLLVTSPDGITEVVEAEHYLVAEGLPRSPGHLVTTDLALTFGSHLAHLASGTA